MNKCPKCGFDRNIKDSKCPRCGVVYLVYSYYLAQKQMDDNNSVIQMADNKGDKGVACPSCGESVREDMDLCPACDALLCFDSSASVSGSSEARIKKLKTYSYGQALLREKEYIFERIYCEQELPAMMKYFALYGLLFSSIYGLSLGMFAGSWQIPVCSVKIPMVLFGTLLLCLPALYILNIFFGTKLTIGQTLTLLLASTYLISVFIGSVSPILCFFILLTKLKKIISILNIIIFGVSGIFGLRLMWKGMNYLNARSSYTSKMHIVKIWYIIYILIIVQVAWILRPFLGEKGEFVLFREIEGNFYLAIFNILSVFFK